MMNAHVIAYYWHAVKSIKIEKASDAWASFIAMTMHASEVKRGAKAC